MKKISLAIPTYFSSKYLSILLRSIKDSKFINEVVISDDSKSNIEKSKIEKILHKFAKDNKSIEFRFVQNKKNLGAFNNKKHSGSWGIGGCLSFYPAKIAGCIGDGGALITNNDNLAKFARSVRDHGRGEDFEAINWGRNSRLDSLNARILIERIKNIHNILAKRRKLASIYDLELKSLEEKAFIKLPPKFSTNSNSLSTYQNYEIQAKNKKNLINYLNEHNIGTIKQWGGFSIAHFSKLGSNINQYPETKSLFEELLLLPMNHMMKEEEVNYVCEKINSFYDK